MILEIFFIIIYIFHCLTNSKSLLVLSVPRLLLHILIILSRKLFLLAILGLLYSLLRLYLKRIIIPKFKILLHQNEQQQQQAQKLFQLLVHYLYLMFFLLHLNLLRKPDTRHLSYITFI